MALGAASSLANMTEMKPTSIFPASWVGLRYSSVEQDRGSHAAEEWLHQCSLRMLNRTHSALRTTAEWTVGSQWQAARPQPERAALITTGERGENDTE